MAEKLETIPNPAGRTWSTLVGKFFHSFDEDGRYVEMQGRILSSLDDPPCFVVQYYEWLGGGHAWGLRLLEKTALLRGRWHFYRTNDEMIEAYEYGGIARPPTAP